MKVLAWIGLIYMILTVVSHVHGIINDKETTGRVAYFTGFLFSIAITIFFIIYLFIK